MSTVDTSNNIKEKQIMARRTAKAAADVTPASPREVREWLQGQDLPEGVTVAARGRLSSAAKSHFTESTGRPIAEPVAAAE